MESFFLAETTKYLYLLFDTDNFIHNQGEHGTIIDTPNGECVIEAGGYIFNTEAHPIDPSALYCCHEVPHQRLFDFDELKSNKKKFRGQPVRVNQEGDEEVSKEKNEEVLDVIEEDNTEVPIEIVADSMENYKVEDNEKLFSKPDDVDKETVDAEESTEANVTGKEKSSEENTKFIRMIKNIIPPTPRQKFDPQKMLERFRYENKYPVNSSWATNYELLSCKAQPFLQKMSLYGEFFNK